MNKQACVYLTSYFGNKLPPFYIGSSYVEKVKNGYCGTVTSAKYKNIWHAELKNNPELFKTRIIKVFSCRKAASEYEEMIQRKLNVVNSSLYINMGYASKNFTDPEIKPWNYGLTIDSDPRIAAYAKKCSKTKRNNPAQWKRSDEHLSALKNRMILDNPSKREDVKEKLRVAVSGENNAMFGVRGEMHPRFGIKHTDEAKAKMRESILNRQPMSHDELIAYKEKQRLRSSLAKWFWNPETGKTSFSIPGSEPAGFVLGRGPRKRKIPD